MKPTVLNVSLMRSRCENRLVARTLEKLGHEKLQQLAELEAGYASARAVERLELSDEQRQQVLRLASNLPAVWQSSTTMASERKEMLGLLVRAGSDYSCRVTYSQHPHCASLAYGSHN